MGRALRVFAIVFGCLSMLVVGGFVILVVLAVAGVGSTRPDATPTVTAKTAATAAPVAVAPSTATPATAPPTATVQPPTAAPPSATATTAPKPAGISPQARAYLDWAIPKIGIAGQAMSGLATQSEAAGKNPRLIADNDWRIKTGVALGFMKNTGQELQAYPGAITEDIRPLDDLMKGLGKDLVVVSDEFAAGLDQGNAARINNAVARMNAATEKIKAATAEVQKLNG